LRISSSARVDRLLASDICLEQSTAKAQLGKCGVTSSSWQQDTRCYAVPHYSSAECTPHCSQL
jgi:hypothetical protein